MGDRYLDKIDPTALKMANELAAIVNADRKAHGLNPLYCVPYLMACAEQRAGEASEVWGHMRPDGSHFSDIIDDDIVKWGNIFENLTAGYDTAESAEQSFRNSPNHWKAILNPDIDHMGIGFVYNPEGYGGCEYYWCQLFVNDQRGDDYVYSGQYLPGEGEAGDTQWGVQKVRIIDYDTGELLDNTFTVELEQSKQYNDLTGLEIRQKDGTLIEYTLKSDNHKATFKTPAEFEITKLLPGEYEIQITIPNGYFYLYEGVNISEEYYHSVGFKMANGTEIPDIDLKYHMQKLTLIKRDIDTGEIIPGVNFYLVSEDNIEGADVSVPAEKHNLIMTFTSGNQPIEFRKMPCCEYTITEISGTDVYIKAPKTAFQLYRNEVHLIEGENKGGFIEDNKLIIYGKKRILTIHPIAYENSIRVYDLSEPQDGFKHNGKAILRPISCTSYKNSDIWDVELVHHVDEWGKWKYLLPENVLKVNGQLFRIDIVETECGEDGATVSVHARHISYDMNDMIIEDAEFDGGNAQDFIDFCMINSYFDYGGDEEHNLFYKEYEFAVTSDISTILKGDKYVNISVMGALIGTDNCLVNRYGGEIYRDNFRVSINEKMENSRENAFYLRYGANVSGIKQRIDYTDFCTWLGCTNNFGDVLAVSFTGDSRWAFHHRRRRFHTLNYADSATAANQFGGDVSRLFGTESSPQVSYTIKLNTLKKDPRFADFSNLLNCDYGDTGTIYCPELNINTKQKVVGIERDEIANEIITIELGNVENSLIRPDFMGNTVTTGHSLFDRLRR